MATTMMAFDGCTISQRAEDIRANWIAGERPRRGLAGRRRSQRFLRLVNRSEPADELWAGGTPSSIDLGRLAANR
jgi:hypothetical protein